MKKFLKSLGIGILMGFLTWFFTSSFELSVTVFLLVTYLEERVRK